MSKKISHTQNAKSVLARRSARKPTPNADAYGAFDRIDGKHPWQESVPDGYVAYPVKILEKGKLCYFNFSLAREMGLIPDSHPNKLNNELTKKVLEAFSIQIVNEYDQLKGLLPPKSQMKSNPYMATRYLQLQHADKQGRTSGDGRSIWNGSYRNKGITWDISSRGTGVTCLAPGAVEAAQPLRTGAGEFGYGCGLADLSELWGSAVMSEIFHFSGIGTERVLAIIDLGRGCGIGVRANPNLIRPAHLFLYLKQGRLETLRQATDYFIQRETQNGNWSISLSAPDRYKKMLSEISVRFAQFAARLEREYIFAWMDWDGDNVLANAGIIDYGSIRQFGLRHDQYRYDDVQRFSTNLNEQRGKARNMVQVFAQMTDFLETGKRRSIEEFEGHASLRTFDREFDRELRRHLLLQIGFDESYSDVLINSHAKQVEALYSAFLALEKTKTKAGQKRVPDGVNRPAVFRMRSALRELPEAVLRHHDLKKLSPEVPLIRHEELLEILTSTFAKRADLRLKGNLKQKLSNFQKSYIKVLLLAYDSKGAKGSRESFLENFVQRARERNARGRLTGNGSEFVVDALTRAKRRGVSSETIQQAVELFVVHQSPKSALRGHMPAAKSVSREAGSLFQELVSIALDYEDDI